jgi:hypothetical protein
MTDTYERKMLSLHAQVGVAVSHFSLIETHLVRIFAISLNIPIELAIRMLAPVRNFTTVLDIIDPLVRHRLVGTAAMPYWTSLLDYVRELSGDRNYLAHTPLIRSTGDEPRIGPSVASILTGETPRIDPMTAGDVSEIILDFEQAAVFLTDFVQALEPRPLPEKFSQPVPRRRPPRGIRQVAARTTPPHPLETWRK